ncbi:CCT domain [Plasmopara halstedii]|uniref:CCT domain n=1 Tax=Plasmopara halstedii TaxID=4781 RepID=A0A0P1AMM8_PLAHL|nr:CCT domain [Plasmopara halstedii]CEG42455.1 CCT domain [Plasmopara halstedii]|eukprot:XP_024578824.1 CCT domain [Plasmopara halstedii]
MKMLVSKKRSRKVELSLPILHQSDVKSTRWLKSDVVEKMRGQLLEIEPRSLSHLSPQELFLSVVLEWQGMSGDISDHFGGYTTNSLDNAENKAASLELSSKKANDAIEKRHTNVKNLSHNMKPLRANYMTEPVKMIGIYTPTARRELLQKYMVKRARRLSQHKVRYGVRKELANARPRVKGRFIKTQQPLTTATAEIQKI